MMEPTVAQCSARGMRRLAQRGASIDVLNSELASLESIPSAASLCNEGVVALRPFPNREDTHRQNPQQRCLASVLQPDHGDVHLGRPVGDDSQHAGGIKLEHDVISEGKCSCAGVDRY